MFHRLEPYTKQSVFEINLWRKAGEYSGRTSSVGPVKDTGQGGNGRVCEVPLSREETQTVVK